MQAQRVVNVKLLILTVVAGCVSAGAAYGIHEFQMPRLADMFLDRADAAETAAESEAEKEAPNEQLRRRHLRDAASQLFHYLKLADRRADVEIRLAEVWD